MEPYTQEEKAQFQAQIQEGQTPDIFLTVEDFINRDLFGPDQQRQGNASMEVEQGSVEEEIIPAEEPQVMLTQDSPQEKPKEKEEKEKKEKKKKKKKSSSKSPTKRVPFWCPCCQQNVVKHSCPHDKCHMGNLCSVYLRNQVQKLHKKERKENKKKAQKEEKEQSGSISYEQSSEESLE